MSASKITSIQIPVEMQLQVSTQVFMFNNEPCFLVGWQSGGEVPRYTYV